ncbi:hypothetical protein [Lentzea sp. E54]|uniref:hypothetical protein n=1 Tax=Lentzea xerophila TaxID=3435883 RepID=UPI003DA4D4A7
MGFSAAVIGSFRRHYAEVVAVVRELEEAGFEVRSPVVSRIINPGAAYVRFETDLPQLSNLDIQAATLAKILDSDVVYLVAPGGYVGRTTCYELGCVQERGIPVYFSEVPEDLPIAIPLENVCAPGELMRRVQTREVGA